MESFIVYKGARQKFAKRRKYWFSLGYVSAYCFPLLLLFLGVYTAAPSRRCSRASPRHGASLHPLSPERSRRFAAYRFACRRYRLLAAGAALSRPPRRAAAALLALRTICLTPVGVKTSHRLPDSALQRALLRFLSIQL